MSDEKITVVKSGDLFEKYSSIYRIVRDECQEKGLDFLEKINLFVNMICQQCWIDNVTNEEFKLILNTMEEGYKIFIEQKKEIQKKMENNNE